MEDRPHRWDKLAAKVDEGQKPSPSCLEAGLHGELTYVDKYGARPVLRSAVECSQMEAGTSSRVKDTFKVITYRFGYGLTYPSGYVLGLLEGLFSESSDQEARMEKLDDILQDLDSPFFLSVRSVALVWTFSSLICIMVLLAIHW